MRLSGIRSHNPVFRRALESDYANENYAVATYKGVAAKTLFYIFLIVVGAFIGFALIANSPESLMVYLPVAVIGGFISALIAIMAPGASKIAGSIYCIFEGTIVGLVSLVFEVIAPGAVLGALVSTFAVLLVVASLYLTRVVKVTNKFVSFLFILSISLILSQFILFILSFIPGIGATVNALFGNYAFNILISLIFVFVATLYLFFDLENVRKIVEGGYPKSLEWYASFGLVFTIIWLYMELLPLIARIISDNN